MSYLIDTLICCYNSLHSCYSFPQEFGTCLLGFACIYPQKLILRDKDWASGDLPLLSKCLDGVEVTVLSWSVLCWLGAFSPVLPNHSHKMGSTFLSGVQLHTVTLRFPLPWTKWHGLNQMYVDTKKSKYRNIEHLHPAQLLRQLIFD